MLWRYTHSLSFSLPLSLEKERALCQGQATGGQGFDGSANAVAAARSFCFCSPSCRSLESILLTSWILHTDTVVAETESKYHVEFSVMDSQGRSHEGHVEVANGEGVLAI